MGQSGLLNQCPSFWSDIRYSLVLNECLSTLSSHSATLNHGLLGTEFHSCTNYIFIMLKLSRLNRSRYTSFILLRLYFITVMCIISYGIPFKATKPNPSLGFKPPNYKQVMTQKNIYYILRCMCHLYRHSCLSLL